MTRLAIRSIQLCEVDACVDTVGLRFCTRRALTELPACAGGVRPQFITRVRTANSDVLKLAGQAMSLNPKGDPGGAVRSLLSEVEKILNAKLIEFAHLVLQRYEGLIQNHINLLQQARALHEPHHGCACGNGRAGAHRRAAGGLSLPSGCKRPHSEGLLAKVH